VPHSLRVTVAAPSEAHAEGGAAAALADRLGGRPGVADVLRLDLARTPGGRVDPFGLRERVPEAEGDVVVLVAGRRWGARRVVPAPVLDGRPIALVQADTPGQLPRCQAQPSARVPWVVAAMAKDDFLAPTAHWARTLKAGGRPAVDLRADRARRDDLLRALAAGPGIVLYAGHGRTRGWSGYQGIRWHHMEADRPGAVGAGLVIAFACDTLKRSRSRFPFGSRLVESGLAGGYLGAAGSVRTRDAEALAEVVIALLARGTHETGAHLMAQLDAELRDGPAASRRAWAQFRFVGDPCVPLPRGGIGVAAA